MGFLVLQTDTIIEKKNVYVTGNLKDRYWFETIGNEILDYQDCLVYIKDEFGFNEDKDFTCKYLLDMDIEIAILVITKNFLLESSRARDAEFAKLKEFRIPVLPIMVEDGLENLFDSVCGNLQLLNRNASGYRNKLSEYLERILVDTKKCNLIQDSFGYECFLSYRKADREEAIDLINAIHNIDECRDVSIWFDDFLVIGEEYNNYIDEHLVKSDFILLLVTPTILEDGNYVMNIEYPRAVELNKKIIPVQVFPTDRDELGQKYPGIPECIMFYREGGMEQLLQAIKEVLHYDDIITDSEKNYLQGLAYIKGINVERNFEYGVRKLKISANAGHKKASQELGNIYNGAYFGYVDYNEAVIWSEKYMDLIQNDLIDNIGQARDLGTVLRDLCDAYRKLDRMEDAKNSLRELYQLNVRFPDIWHTDSTIGMAYIYLQSAVICYLEKKYESAIQCLDKAEAEVDILLSFRSLRVELTMKAMLHEVQEKLYQEIYEEEGNIEYKNLSIHYLERFINVSRELLKYGIKKDHYDLYYALRRYGEAYLEMGIELQNLDYMSNAYVSFKDAYDLICHIVDKINRDMINEMFNIACLYAHASSVIGNAYEKQWQVSEAKDFYQKSFDMWDILYKKMPDEKIIRDGRNNALESMNRVSDYLIFN